MDSKSSVVSDGEGKPQEIAEKSKRDRSFAGACQQTPGLLSRRPPAPDLDKYGVCLLCSLGAAVSFAIWRESYMAGVFVYCVVWPLNMAVSQ
jgi:hypothetical protein